MLISTLLTLFFVISKFTSEQQGYYYTILSIVAFQTLAEFGFNTGLTHFISHEWCHLSIEKGQVIGDQNAQARLRSLLRITAVWTVVSTFILVVGIGFGGEYFLSTYRKSTTVEWEGPWWAVCFMLIPGSISATLRCIAESVDRVAFSQKSILIGSIIGNCVAWVAFILDAQLYIIALNLGVSALITIFLLAYSLKPILKLYFFPLSMPKINWRKDFMPHQLRIGISWICGLAMFQTFVPFIFYYRGAIEAGQAGILLQAYSLANTLGMAWVISNTPNFGKAWVLKDPLALNALTNKIGKKSAYTVIFAAAMGMIIVALIKYYMPQFGNRIGSLSALYVLFLTCIIMQSSNAYTAAVRFQKKEKFLMSSIISAGLVISSNYWMSQLSVEFVFLGFFIIMSFVLVPWIYFIYNREINNMSRSEG